MVENHKPGSVPGLNKGEGVRRGGGGGGGEGREGQIRERGGEGEGKRMVKNEKHDWQGRKRSEWWTWNFGDP